VNTRWRQAALVEKYIDGREYSVALLGGRVLAVSEIRFSLPPGHPRIVTYGAKWRPGSAEDRGTTPVCPAPLDPGERRRIESTARRAYAAIGCTAHARVDLRDCLVLEVNPNPDLSPDAGFARAARAAGMSYERVLEELIDGAHPPAGRR
jgi:D-alanine-D-alanine ligase